MGSTGVVAAGLQERNRFAVVCGGLQPRVRATGRLPAHDPIPVTIAHAPVRRVLPAHGRDPVPPRLLARDSAVAVVDRGRERKGLSQALLNLPVAVSWVMDSTRPSRVV